MNTIKQLLCVTFIVWALITMVEWAHGPWALETILKGQWETVMELQIFESDEPVG